MVKKVTKNLEHKKMCQIFAVWFNQMVNVV